jgi:antibiotic biosynthesis monooxygenase (ABM) superfamily enzyme
MTSDDKASTSLDEVKLDTPVTTVIRQQPRPEAVARYEEWLKEITPIAQQFAGHRGVNVIRPHVGSEVYVIVLHFDTTHLSPAQLPRSRNRASDVDRERDVVLQ